MLVSTICESFKTFDKNYVQLLNELNFETISGCFMQFPTWLSETGFKDPTDPVNVPWQLSHDSDQPMNWPMSNPQQLEYFIGWMMVQREGLPIWLDKFPFETLNKGATPDAPVFVNVGGGAGH